MMDDLRQKGVIRGDIDRQLLVAHSLEELKNMIGEERRTLFK